MSSIWCNSDKPSIVKVTTGRTAPSITSHEMLHKLDKPALSKTWAAASIQCKQPFIHGGIYDNAKKSPIFCRNISNWAAFGPGLGSRPRNLAIFSFCENLPRCHAPRCLWLSVRPRLSSRLPVCAVGALGWSCLTIRADPIGFLHFNVPIPLSWLAVAPLRRG